MTRPKRWTNAISVAQAAVAELLELQEEYQEWLDSIPENFEQSPVAEKLGAVCDLGVEEIMDILDECEGADLPLGFGRD